MATHRIEVLIGGSSPLSDTEANRRTVFVFAGTTPQGSSTGSIGTQRGARVPPSGQYHLDLNHPRIPSALSVSSFSPASYESEILTGQPGLVDQLSESIEKGYIRILDVDAAISGQTGGSATMAAVSSNVITVTGLTGMTADSVGKSLTISGATTGANNGTFQILAFTSATEVDILAGAAPGGDASNGSLTWTENGDDQDRTSLSALL